MIAVELVRTGIFAVFVYVLVCFSFVWVETKISYGVTSSVVTSIREEVIRNNLIKVGFLFNDYEKDLFFQIALVKNGKNVLGGIGSDDFWLKRINRIIYADEREQVPFAEVVFTIDLRKAYFVSFIISIFITFIYSMLMKSQKKREIKKLQEKLEKEKIFELKKQAQEFVHDIRSPLVSLELALAQLDASSMNSREIGVMNRSVIRIKEIGNRFVENQEINQDWVELIVVAKEMRDLIQDKIAELSINIQLEIDNSAENCKVLASRDLFKRMISNLINNSYEAIKNTGKKPEIQLSLKVINDQVVFTLEDNGVGFPEKMLKNKEFNPLTTKNTGKGIGLSTAYSNLVKWGGKLNIDNKNEGAIVRVYLKNYEDYQVVLIDDDELNRMIWEREARKINIDFFSYEDYSDEVGNKINTKNSLIYLDSNLGHDKKGEDLIEQIKLAAKVDVCFFIETGNEKSKYKNFANISGVSNKKPNWIT